MTLTAQEMPKNIKVTESLLLAGIRSVNKNHALAKPRKRVGRPKKEAALDCSSLYPKGMMMAGDFFVSDRGANRLQSVIKLVCRLYDVSKIELLGEGRQLNVVQARRCLSVVLRHGGWSTPRIGKVINRDHTSVLHNLKQFKNKADETERENAAYVTEFYMSYDRHKTADFNNMRCVNELIAGLINARVGTLKTKLKNKEMLANLQCLLAYLLHDIGFGFEEIAAVRDCEAKQIEGRCDYIENRCDLPEIHALKDQIIDRLARLRGAA